ncbi:hypothetical protein TESG_08374 [Trichophyton tonsurans CBS 112818]|uniref:Uncharacterized protein n=1 Tax=Trichophyton tonsurans (strain CBS 112818) TaxID=647933 RepID=F2RVD0_TRIT1|nr:hypothetical protein TESG_08374 [Trichophyton tonsurans CBS 112818]
MAEHCGDVFSDKSSSLLIDKVSQGKRHGFTQVLVPQERLLVLGKSRTFPHVNPEGAMWRRSVIFQLPVRDMDKGETIEMQIATTEAQLHKSKREGYIMSS